MTENIFEQLLYSTVLIECLDSKGAHLCIGTGFFLHKQVGPGAYKIFLVTNRHVLDRDVDSISLVFTKAKNGEPLVGQCEEVLIERVGRMVIHPNVDLAVLDISALIARFPDTLYFKAVPYEALADFEEPELSVAAPVYFIGYPEGISDVQNNFPLVRKGIISSHPKVDFNDLPQVIVDAQVFPGSSGSPVFVNLRTDGQMSDGRPIIKLLGVVTATFLKGQDTLGLGIVIKATCLRQMIDDIS